MTKIKDQNEILSAFFEVEYLSMEEARKKFAVSSLKSLLKEGLLEITSQGHIAQTSKGRNYCLPALVSFEEDTEEPNMYSHKERMGRLDLERMRVQRRMLRDEQKFIIASKQLDIQADRVANDQSRFMIDVAAGVFSAAVNAAPAILGAIYSQKKL